MRVCVFDFHGTLVDVDDLLRESWKQALGSRYSHYYDQAVKTNLIKGLGTFDTVKTLNIDKKNLKEIAEKKENSSIKLH